jgi:hypothetical protein
VFDKVDELQERVKQGTTLSTIIQMYDDLNLLCRRIRKKVEAQLRKFKVGNVPWSPEIQRLMDERKLWTNVIKWYKGIRISKKKIYRQMKRLGIVDAFHINLLEAQLKRNQAQTEWLAAIKKSPDLRRDWLKSLSEARAAKNKTEPESELKHLKQREKQREEARRRKTITGKGADKAKTTKLYYSELDPVTGEVVANVECIDKDSMDAACIKENKTRMTRALRSPFAKSPLLEDFGYLADTEAAQAVLDGTYDPPAGIDPYAKLLL